MGTSAPGTALALGRAVQIRGEEHFARMVHPWSCSAVPLRDRTTGMLLGVLDVTGGEAAVAPATLPLLEATAAAVEAELALIERGRAPIPALAPAPLELSATPALRVTGPTPHRPSPVLSILGRDDGVLRSSAGEVRLSQRHAEILTVLADRPEGLSATELADAVYGRDDAVVTLRAPHRARGLRRLRPPAGRAA